MNGSDLPTRHYTDREVGAILKRAVEIQAGHSDGGLALDALDGTTLDQLQQAAVELGLDPALIAQAAAEVRDVGGVGRVTRLFGGPWSIDSDHIIEGMVTEEDWAALVEEIRASTGRVGYPKIVGKAFEWLSLQPDPLHVSVTPHGSNTRVRVTARFGPWAGMWYMLSTVLGIVLAVLTIVACGKSAALNPAVILSLLAAFPLGSLVGTRLTVGPLLSSKRQKTRALISTIERWISQSHQSIVTPSPIQTLPSITTLEEDLPLEQVNRLA
ncbi:MAG: hypothetical protein JWL77_3877 [Chthonomonadaceae bacterium]|nr:hypothetical protein [Chthonomonadaceae bacterium]